MVVVKKGGSTSYYISVSTAIDGADSATVGPDGDTVYLYAESYKLDRANKDKMKEYSNNNSAISRMGKMARTVDLTKCIICDVDGAPIENTKEYNTIITLLDYWCDLSKAAIYVIIVPLVENTGFVQPTTNRTINLALSRSGANPRYAFKCALKRLSTKPVGNVYMVDLAFKETTLY